MAESPVRINNPNKSSEAPNIEQKRQMEQAYSQMKRKMQMENISKSICR